jgi:DNA replication and repair protein RecF
VTAISGYRFEASGGSARADGARPAVRLGRLTLTDFRNYAALRLDTDGVPVVLTGPNGSGKTNLLEAISLLAPGRGFRGAPFEELIRRSAAGFAVAADIDGPQGRIAAGTAFQIEPEADQAAGGQRQVKLAGRLCKGSGALAQHARILWLTPAMDRLFSGPPGDRRRFLDGLVTAFDPAHSIRVGQFERAMRERNRLLAELPLDGRWLAAIETQMAESAVALAAARVSALDALTGYVGQTLTARFGGSFPWVKVAVEGAIEDDVRGGPAVQAEDAYRQVLQDGRRLDQAAGRTLAGPHRSEFLVTHGPKNIAAESCSTGEQKALLIGMILAHARAVRDNFQGYAPLLLLDEVAAHLDAERRAGLFAELRELGAQAFMTGTDEMLFAAARADAAFLRIEAGQLFPSTNGQ